MCRFLLLTLLWTPAAAQGRWPAEIAFVDVERVVLSYEKTRKITEDLENQIKVDRARIVDLQTAHEERVAALREEESIDILDQARVLERIKRQKQLAEERVEIEIQMAVVSANLEQRLASHLRKVYAEICAECERVAKGNGIRAVYMVRNNELEKGQTKKAVMAAILLRPVLYYSPELDLTNLVIERQNRWIPRSLPPAKPAAGGKAPEKK